MGGLRWRAGTALHGRWALQKRVSLQGRGVLLLLPNPHLVHRLGRQEQPPVPHEPPDPRALRRDQQGPEPVHQGAARIPRSHARVFNTGIVLCRHTPHPTRHTHTHTRTHTHTHTHTPPGDCALHISYTHFTYTDHTHTTLKLIWKVHFQFTCAQEGENGGADWGGRGEVRQRWFVEGCGARGT